MPGFLVGTLSLQIRADLDASVTAVAAGVTVFFGAGAFGAGRGGRFAERIGALTAMRGSALVTAVCLLLIATLASSLAPFLVLLAIAGVANSVSQPAINLFMAEQVPLERQGLAFGIKQSAIPAAILVSGLALPLIALPLGWRWAFALFGVAALAVALLAGRGRHRSRRCPSASRRGRPTRALLLIAVGAALASAGPNALGTYLVPSAVDAGIAEGTAGLLAALGSATSLAVRIGLGARADARGEYGFAWVVRCSPAARSASACWRSSEVAPFVLGALIAFTLGWGWPGLFNLAVVHGHRHAPGWATGISQSGIYIGAAGGPAAYGLLADAIGYGPAWGLTAGLLLLAAATIWLAARLARLPPGDRYHPNRTLRTGIRHIWVPPRRSLSPRGPRSAGLVSCLRRLAPGELRQRASRRTRACPRRSPRVAASASWAATSCSSVSASAGLAAASITRFASPTARGAHASSSFANASVHRVELVRRRRSGSRTRSGAPRAPSMTLPVMISSFALPRPTTAGSREQPPTSGSSPTRTSMIPATASRAIVRKSQASASSNAPPSAAPWIWQIVGFGISSSRFHQRSSGRRNARSRDESSARSRRSLRSIPEENSVPSPRTHDHAHGVVGGGGLDRAAELGDRLAVERVALLRAVEDEVADRSAVLGRDQWHVCSRRSTTWSPRR